MFGKAVIAGPHLENFRDVEEHFMAHRRRCGLPPAANWRRRWYAPRPIPIWVIVHTRRRARSAARRSGWPRMPCCPSTTHAIRRTVQCSPPGCFSVPRANLARRERVGPAAQARAGASATVPVVSVGNITAGGTGKTPVTIDLLRGFEFAQPGLLSRGHGRQTSEMVLMPRGDENLPIGLTGDEAQIYVRGTRVPIGIGAERYDVGVELLKSAPVRVFFLDDGFQHLQLKRDFDRVLIDSLNPFGGGHLCRRGAWRAARRPRARRRVW